MRARDPRRGQCSGGPGYPAASPVARLPIQDWRASPPGLICRLWLCQADGKGFSARDWACETPQEVWDLLSWLDFDPEGCFAACFGWTPPKERARVAETSTQGRVLNLEDLL